MVAAPDEEKSVENPLADKGAAAEEGEGEEEFAHDLRKLVYEGDGAGVFAKFLGGVFLVTLTAFLIPVPDACDGNQPVGEWPSDQILFYVSVLPGVIVMFAPIPLFAYVMTDNFHHEGQKGRNEKSIAQGLASSFGLASVTAVLTLALCAMWAYGYFGFPAPFTQVLGGMPGYFMTYTATVFLIAATTDNVESHKVLAVDMSKILVCLYIIFQNVVLFSLLAAMIKNQPQYATLFAVAFNVVRPAPMPCAHRSASRCLAAANLCSFVAVLQVKFIAKSAIRFTFKSDFDKIIPFHMYVCMNCAVMPACLLPSAVSFTTLILVWFIDMSLLFFSLKGMWIPAVKVYFTDRTLQKERARLDESDKELAKEQADVDQAEANLAKQKETLEKEKADLQEATAAADTSGDADAKARVQKEAAEVEAAQRQYDEKMAELKKEKAELDVALTNEEEERAIELQAEAAEAAELAKKDEAFTAENVKETEFTLLLLITDEMIEFVVPFGVTALEVFLYFGWNPNAVPLISGMEFDAFLESTLAKLTVGFLHVITCWMARNIINSSTEIRVFTVLTWAVKNYSECLIVASASVFIFCYGALMPHFNLNIDGLGHLFMQEAIGGAAHDKGLAHEDLVLHPQGCYNDTYWSDVAAMNMSALSGTNNTL
eukprot:SAG22_NODE_280_length_13084_cov_3.480209_9_plen_656_part_00